MVASTVGPTGAILLAHKRSFGSPLGRQNSHSSRRIRRELTWTRGVTSELGFSDIRKFSEERERWRRGRERTAPPAAESMLLGTEGTENQEVQQLKPRRNGSEELLRITRIAGDGPS